MVSAAMLSTVVRVATGYAFHAFCNGTIPIGTMMNVEETSWEGKTRGGRGGGQGEGNV